MHFNDSISFYSMDWFIVAKSPAKGKIGIVSIRAKLQFLWKKLNYTVGQNWQHKLWLLLKACIMNGFTYTSLSNVIFWCRWASLSLWWAKENVSEIYWEGSPSKLSLHSKEKKLIPGLEGYVQSNSTPCAKYTFLALMSLKHIKNVIWEILIMKPFLQI